MTACVRRRMAGWDAELVERALIAEAWTLIRQGDKDAVFLRVRVSWPDYTPDRGQGDDSADDRAHAVAMSSAITREELARAQEVSRWYSDFIPDPSDRTLVAVAAIVRRGRYRVWDHDAVGNPRKPVHNMNWDEVRHAIRKHSGKVIDWHPRTMRRRYRKALEMMADALDRAGVECWER